MSLLGRGRLSGSPKAARAHSDGSAVDLTSGVARPALPGTWRVVPATATPAARAAFQKAGSMRLAAAGKRSTSGHTVLATGEIVCGMESQAAASSDVPSACEWNGVGAMGIR